MRRFNFISVNIYVLLIAMGAIGLSLVSLGTSAPKMRLPNKENIPTKDFPSSVTDKVRWPPKIEELELQNLKTNYANIKRRSSESSNNDIVKNAKRIVSTEADTSLKTVPPRPTKLPVNEELPAASDNSNSERVSSESSQGKSEDSKRKKISEGGLMANRENTAAEDSATELVSNANTNNTNNMDISEYTPRDVAEYIFRTGDEKGVALAIYQFILQDLLSRDYAIQFLEAVKEELNAMKNRNPSLAHQVNTDESSSISNKTTPSSYSENESGSTSSLGEIVVSSAAAEKKGRDEEALMEQTPKKRMLRNSNVMEHERSNYNLNPMMIMGNNNDVDGNSETEYEAVSGIQSPNGVGDGFGYPGTQSQSQLVGEKPHEPRRGPRKSYSIEDLDYDELVEKLQVAESKLREYSLEEVIYYLAKELFSQGLHETEQTHEQHSIQKFAQVIENGAAMGYIPKDLEKTILDTLVRALVDAVMEHEHGLTSHRVPANRINVNTPPNAPHQIKMR